MNTSLNAAEKWLKEMGIRTISHPTALWVNRDDMVGIVGSENYDEILAALKEALNTTKIFWGGKNDDYLFLESF